MPTFSLLGQGLFRIVHHQTSNRSVLADVEVRELVRDFVERGQRD